MDTHRSLRQRLQSTVLEASTWRARPTTPSSSGRFCWRSGAAAEPDPWAFSPAPHECALDRSGAERLPGGVCGGLVLHWPWWRSHAATCSATGLIDAWRSVLLRVWCRSCCCGCSSSAAFAGVQAACSSTTVLGQALGQCPHHWRLLFLSFCSRWCWVTASSDRKRPARLPVPVGGEWRLLGDRDHDHRGRRCGAQTELGRLLAGGDALGFGIIAIPTEF